MMQRSYQLLVTTQGPLYPPSEIMDDDGNFVVIGNLNSKTEKGIETKWGAAIVSVDSPVPEFGKREPYNIIRTLDLCNLQEDGQRVLHTLPLPLPCNNYDMLFAPEQCPNANEIVRKCLPLHQAVPDYQPEHSRQYTSPITLGNWVKANGRLTVTLLPDGTNAEFYVEMEGLIPESLYTIMALREGDLMPGKPTRPGPLGVPNCFVTDENGSGKYRSVMRNPFPKDSPQSNRIINIVVLFMSTQCCHGGAIGWYGLGGDIHAQLKCPTPVFQEFNTQ